MGTQNVAATTASNQQTMPLVVSDDGTGGTNELCHGAE
jgi:hypothetical protein